MRLLPIHYAIRNGYRSISRSLQLVLGAALVIFLLIAALAFHQGMLRSLHISADDSVVIILGAGSEESIERSQLSLASEEIIAANISSAAQVRGRSAVSGEVYYNGLLGFTELGGAQSDWQHAQAVMRGVTPMALATHQSVRVVEGRFPRSGEVMLGRYVHYSVGRAEPFMLGDQVEFEGQVFRVAGLFVAPGTVLESEIWFDRNDLMTATQRDSLSAVMVRCDDITKGLAEIEYFCVKWLDLELTSMAASTYYQKLGVFFAPLRWMAWITAGLMAGAALFGGLNTWYAAFASRQRELATLQAIGFRRRVILVSLIQESLLATLCGTVCAMIVALLLLDQFQVALASGVFSLSINGSIVLSGLITGVLLGIIGCLPPAYHCLKPALASSLRS